MKLIEQLFQPHSIALVVAPLELRLSAIANSTPTRSAWVAWGGANWIQTAGTGF